MTLACTHTLNLCGLQARLVRVEADLSGGLPQFNLIGMPAHPAREARDRIRVAIQNLGFGFPAGRVTVQLTAQDALEAPELADLAIAAAVLMAMGRIPASALKDVALLGQLTLSGGLLPIEHELAWMQAARSASAQLITPVPRGALAFQVGDLQHRVVNALADLVDFARGSRTLKTIGALAHPEAAKAQSQADRGTDPSPWDEVSGQPGAKRAALVALAGGHHLLMLGPPGVGKSMIAHRLPALLPALAQEDAQQLAAIQALHGGPDAGLSPARPPFRAPHHTASAAALFGGGRPFRPGEISLAHGGILFLDELAEFRRDALEALREPLETGWVQPARLQSRFVMPARTQLVAAMNPCPCGLFGTVRAHSTPCRCTPKQVQAYRAKLSAPLLDRFDLIVLMQTASPAPVLPVQAAVPLASSARVSQVLGKDWTAAEAQAAVRAARDLARARQSVLNAHLSEGALQRLPVQPGALMLLNQLARTASWSRRVLGRFQRVARTIADLQGMEAIDEACLAEAVSLRRGLQIDDGMPA